MRSAAFIIFIFLSVAATAQVQQSYTPPTKEELVARRKEIMASISETQKQLDAITNDKKATLGQLRALQNKLAERQKLIGNINDEVNNIDKDIKVSSREVLTLKQKLDQLKMRYAQSIRYAYTSRSSYDMIAFLFSSHDFNDAMRRMKYLKKFRDFRRQQVDQIHVTQNELKVKIGTLNEEKSQKDELLNNQVQQKQVLVKETSQTNQVIQDLKGKEKDLLKDIEKNRQATVRMNKAIQSIIEREMAKAAKAAEEEARKAAAANPNKPTIIKTVIRPGNTGNGTAVNDVHSSSKHKTDDVPLLLTPTAVALASSFEGNKGKMYWPVEKGVIVDHFGVHPHPIEQKVMVENLGIDIKTTTNAAVKAVFEGTVSTVANMDGVKFVMITHGNYYTLYNNLATTSIEKGQHVSTGQVIGTAATNEDNEPTVKFQIWKSNGGKRGSVNLNPEQWLGKAH